MIELARNRTVGSQFMNKAESREQVAPPSRIGNPSHELPGDVTVLEGTNQSGDFRIGTIGTDLWTSPG